MSLYKLCCAKGRSVMCLGGQKKPVDQIERLKKDAMQFNASEQQPVPDAETTTESNY